MELLTHLAPGPFNAVKFIILYFFIGHLMVWARCKLKRSVNVSYLVRGVPVRIEAITDSSTRGTVKNIYHNIRDSIQELWTNISEKGLQRGSGRGTREGRLEMSIMQKLHLMASRLLARSMPVLILAAGFALEYGTGDDKRCKEEQFKFGDPRVVLGVLPSVVPCTKLSDTQREKDNRTTFLIQYTNSHLRSQDVLCGCAEWTDEYCVSTFNGTAVPPARIMPWTTVVRDMNSRSDSNLRLLQDVRDDFAMPSYIPWKLVPESVNASLVHVSCYFYNGTTRMSVGCIRKHAYRFGNQSYTEIVMVAQSNKSLSYIHSLYPNIASNISGYPEIYFDGMLDGPSAREDSLSLVFQSKSTAHKLSVDVAVAASLHLIFQYNMMIWNLWINEGTARQLARILTSFYTAQPEGRGFVQTCKGTVLTLNRTGIIASLVLVTLLALVLIMAAVTTPERHGRIFRKGKTLESEEWAFHSALSQLFGLNNALSGDHVDAVAVLERQCNELHFKFAQPGTVSESCARGEISLIL